MAEELRQLRKRAAERARDQLEQGGDEEGKLADRARELGQKGARQGVAPAAGDRVDRGRGARGAAGGRCAQAGRRRQGPRAPARGPAQPRGGARAAARRRRRERRRRPTGGSEGKQPSPGHVDVPDDHKGPEEFRRRVVRGLGQPAAARSGTRCSATRRGCCDDEGGGDVDDCDASRPWVLACVAALGDRRAGCRRRAQADAASDRARL